MELEKDSLLQLKILDEEEDLVGKLNFGHSRVRPVLTFLDYKINMNINFVPIIAIDYSLSNKLQDETTEDVNGSKSLHSPVENGTNDYISVINHIRHVYKDISSYCMGFGFGGKTCPTQTKASDIFALSGNMFDPTISHNQILECYNTVNNMVELFLPVKFRSVLE